MMSCQQLLSLDHLSLLGVDELRPVWLLWILTPHNISFHAFCMTLLIVFRGVCVIVLLTCFTYCIWNITSSLITCENKCYLMFCVIIVKIFIVPLWLIHETPSLSRIFYYKMTSTLLCKFEEQYIWNKSQPSDSKNCFVLDLSKAGEEEKHKRGMYSKAKFEWKKSQLCIKMEIFEFKFCIHQICSPAHINITCVYKPFLEDSNLPSISDATSFSSIPGALSASINWFQVASGCLWSHNSNISPQHSLTFPALFFLTTLRARSSFWSNNSSPTSYQLGAIDSLTCLKYFRAGWSEPVVVKIKKAGIA